MTMRTIIWAYEPSCEAESNSAALLLEVVCVAGRKGQEVAMSRRRQGGLFGEVGFLGGSLEKILGPRNMKSGHRTILGGDQPRLGAGQRLRLAGLRYVLVPNGHWLFTCTRLPALDSRLVHSTASMNRRAGGQLFVRLTSPRIS